LLAFFEKTASEMFFEQPVHGIKRGVGAAAREHQAVPGAPDDVAIVSQGGFGEVDAEFRGRPSDVHPAGFFIVADRGSTGPVRQWPV